MVGPNSLRSIVAVTGEHGRYAAVRARAAALAADSRTTVILYDLDAASAFSSPVPTNWSAGGAEEDMPDRLSAEDAERAGRGAIAAQVRGLRDAGVDAWAWLPSDAGGDALADYARDQGADLILVPEELESPSLLDRLQGKDVEQTVEAGSVPVVVVNSDGQGRMA